MEKAFGVPNNGCSDNQMEMRVGKTDRPGTHWDSALTAAGSHRKCVPLHVNSHVFHQAVQHNSDKATCLHKITCIVI